MVITVKSLQSGIPEGEHAMISIPPGLTSNISTSKEAFAVPITRTEIEFVSHTQYTLDLAMKVSMTSM